MELTQTKKPNEKDNKKDDVFDSISAGSSNTPQEFD